ncbi:MAG TPA: PDZ domain-containing protein [Polyangiaceae bacterium]
MNPAQLQRIATTLGGIAVWSTAENSLARAAGLRYGDVILSVNGEPTPSIRAYFKAKALSADRMTLTYFRLGRTHYVSVPISRASSPPASDSSLQDFVSTRATALLQAVTNRRLN